jgi:tetratricopeptide (TPR) repeat protein
MDYTAVGDTTNLAARLQQTAQPGSVVISAVTQQHIAGFFETRDLGEIAVKGRAPVRAFEVLRSRGCRTRFDVAVEKAMTRSAYREAVTSFEQALAALAQFPECRGTIAQAIDLRCDLRNALFPLSECGRIEGYLREAEALTGSLDDPRRLGWVSAFMSGHLMATGGHASDVRTFAQRVQDVGETLGDVSLQVVAQYYLIHAGHLSGDYRGTEILCRRLIQSLQGERARERFGLAIFPAVLSRAYLARSLAEQGAFDEANAHGHEAIRIAEALDHSFSIVNACLGLAYVDGVRGELSQAARLLERAVALCRDWDITFWTPIGLASLGHVYTWSGRVREGVSWLQQALSTYESAGFGLFHSLSASSQDHLDVATAEAHYSAATALASALGMRPLLAHCHYGLGILYNRIGRPEQARTELVAAIELYRAMEMIFWLERAEAVLAQIA